MTTKEKIKIFTECGISQTKIADLASINRSTLSKWMNGTRLNVGEETEAALEAALFYIADKLYKAVNGEIATEFKYDDIELE